jgi:hypothetical protein
VKPARNPNRPTVPEIRPYVAAIYARPGGGAGCCLHVVLDDHNVSDVFVRGCLESAQSRGHLGCALLAVLLLRMTRTQRLKLGHSNFRTT